MSTGKKNLVLVTIAGMVVLSAPPGLVCAATSDAPKTLEGEPPAKLQPRGGSLLRVGEVELRRVDKASGGSLKGYLQTLAALGIVVLLIFLTRVVLRRFGRPIGIGIGKPRTTGPVELLSRTQVGPRQQLLLVRLGQRLVLVGCSPEGFSALSEITDADEHARIAAEFTGARGNPASGRFERTEPSAVPQDAPVDTVREVTDRIRRYCYLEENQR